MATDLELYHKHKIPVIILSSQGVGDTIPMVLKKEGVLFDNIEVITNIFEYDEEGSSIDLDV